MGGRTRGLGRYCVKAHDMIGATVDVVALRGAVRGYVDASDRACKYWEGKE